MNSSLRPPKKIEVHTGNFKVRIILLAVCLLAAAVFLGRGLTQLLSKQNGWQQVEISSKEINCSADFTLNYYFGDSGMSVSAEYRQISALYSEACEESYQYFYRAGELAGIVPNETVTVSEPLYDALEKVHDAGDRRIYLAPVYAEYDRIFLCETEAEAALYDPMQHSDIAADIAKTAAICSDPDMIGLELLGDCSVRLHAADEYLAFAEEHGVTEYLDFGWMKNAFIADFIADKLAGAGFTRGYLASYDGFTRNLDGSGTSYSQNIFTRQDNLVDMPAVMQYTGPMSIVFLRDYPMSEADRWHYFAFSDGSITTAFADPSDGSNRSCVHELVAYSHGKSCADILLETAPVWQSEELDEAQLLALSREGIHAVWADGTELRHSEKDVSLTLLEESYTKAYAAP